MLLRKLLPIARRVVGTGLRAYCSLPHGLSPEAANGLSSRVLDGYRIPHLHGLLDDGSIKTQPHAEALDPLQQTEFLREFELSEIAYNESAVGRLVNIFLPAPAAPYLSEFTDRLSPYATDSASVTEALISEIHNTICQSIAVIHFRYRYAHGKRPVTVPRDLLEGFAVFRDDITKVLLEKKRSVNGARWLLYGSLQTIMDIRGHLRQDYWTQRMDSALVFSDSIKETLSALFSPDVYLVYALKYKANIPTFLVLLRRNFASLCTTRITSQRTGPGMRLGEYDVALVFAILASQMPEDSANAQLLKVFKHLWMMATKANAMDYPLLGDLLKVCQLGMDDIKLSAPLKNNGCKDVASSKDRGALLESNRTLIE